MEISVLGINGQDTGRKVSLPESVFGIEPNDHAMYLDVKQYLANQRQGTHKSKEKWEISRTTKKLKRQKGTGGARAGSMKSPLFRGGGRAFGPQPRDYSFKLNKKLKELARKSALTYKARNNELIIVEDFQLDQPKTKGFIGILSNLKVAAEKTLCVISNSDRNIVLSSRNVPNARVVRADSLNTYNLLDNTRVVLTESSVALINQSFEK